MYQVRHKTLGIFQCMFLGCGLWTELSNEPELGICDFNTIEEANKFIDYICSHESSDYIRTDFSVEAFDAGLHDIMTKKQEVSSVEV